MLFTTPEPNLIDWLQNAGSIGILAAAVVAFLRGWVVPGAVCKQLREERDRALELVYKQAQLAERALEVSERRSK